MAEQVSPFIAGARVAVEVDGGFRTDSGYREEFVDKAHKSGRFTLRGSAQQWRPSAPWTSKNYWSAEQTGGNSWPRSPHLRIWDDAADAEITATIAKAARYQKFTKLKREIENARFSAELVTDEVLDQFQIVVLAIKPIPDKST